MLKEVTDKTSKRSKGVFLALLSSSIFGLIPFFSIPLMQDGMSMPNLLFFRFLFSAIIMGAISAFKKIDIRISFKELGVLIILSILFASTSLFLLASYSLIPSGVATTIHYLFPILVTAIMIFLYKEKKSMLILGLSFLAFIGVGLLCWTNGNTLSVLGITFALVTVVTYALYIVGTNKFGMDRLNSYVITFYVLFFGVIIFAIYALFTTGIQPLNASKEWIYLILLAFLPTVIADFALILSIKYAGATISAILGVMEPVVAFVVGILYLSEPFSYQSLIGLFLVLLAVTLVVRISTKGKKSKDTL